LSSAFPFDATGCWLPRPLSASFSGLENPQNRKALKGIRYLHVAQFNQFINGQSLALTDLLDVQGRPRQPDIWVREVTQRVKINYDADSEPFYLEKLYAQKNTGLYFIAHAEQEIDWMPFQAALRLLGDNGIGLQRGLGNGQFEVEEATLTLDLPTNATQWMSLALYRPTNREEVASVLPNSYYQFTRRGGWISVPENEAHLSLRKKAVMVFTEGSVFAFGNGNQRIMMKGDSAINLQPDEFKHMHPIWRDGRAIFLPMKS
jgi:CRISPR-associated protein Csm4